MYRSGRKTGRLLWADRVVRLETNTKYRAVTRASDTVLTARSNIKGKRNLRDLGIDERREPNGPYRLD
jgi:hypothetical protein